MRGNLGAARKLYDMQNDPEAAGLPRQLSGQIKIGVMFMENAMFTLT